MKKKCTFNENMNHMSNYFAGTITRVKFQNQKFNSYPKQIIYSRCNQIFQYPCYHGLPPEICTGMHLDLEYHAHPRHKKTSLTLTPGPFNTSFKWNSYIEIENPLSINTPVYITIARHLSTVLAGNEGWRRVNRVTSGLRVI